MLSLQTINSVLESHDALQVSEHFSLRELVHTNHSIINWPTDAGIVLSLEALCLNILEKVRIRGPVHINSGYRSAALNAAIPGAAKKSQHMKGEAADFHIKSITNYDLARWIAHHLDFDQLILENYVSGQPFSGWVHCSFRHAPARRHQVLTKFKGDKHYTPGLYKEKLW